MAVHMPTEATQGQLADNTTPVVPTVDVQTTPAAPGEQITPTSDSPEPQPVPPDESPLEEMEEDAPPKSLTPAGPPVRDWCPADYTLGTLVRGAPTEDKPSLMWLETAREYPPHAELWLFLHMPNAQESDEWYLAYASWLLGLRNCQDIFLF